MHLTPEPLLTMSDEQLEHLHNDCRNREKAYRRAGLFQFSAMWGTAASEVLRLLIVRSCDDYADSLSSLPDRLFD
jgi:hypothetical protein